MPKIHRLKHSFSAGEISPLLDGRVDFARHNNGCKYLKNAYCHIQGPVSRRSGFRYLEDLTALGLDPSNPRVRLVPFIFDEVQAYVLIFFQHLDGEVYVVFGMRGGGLIRYPDTVPTECPPGNPISVTPGSVVSLQVTDTTGGGELPPTWDIENFDYAQSADELYIAQSGWPPTVITRYSHTCWTIETPEIISQPEEWSDENGYPERVTFHQQRLVFAANKMYRQTVWLSKAGSFLDFGISDPLVASDGISFTLDSGTQNKIMWLVSSKALNIGTMGNEWTVVGSNQTALTPENVLAQKQTNNGSEGIKPLSVGLATLFIERYGRTVNEFVYDVNYDSYKNMDLTILAPHLTEKYSIIDWCYQQTPNSTIWAVREDGTIICCTYQREHEVVGWHRHTTQGKFKCITSIPGDSREDDVWVVVQRQAGGEDRYYLERLGDTFLGDSTVDGRFLDSWVHVKEDEPFNVVTGLEHLEGQVVTPLTDGGTHPPVIVENGQVQLDAPYKDVVVGLPFETLIYPLLADLRLQDGTALGRMQRIVKLDISFYKSVGCIVARADKENGMTQEELPFRAPTSKYGEPVPLYTAVFSWDFVEGFDRQSEYFIKQIDPLPMTILFIVDSVEAFD